ncbi:C-X-C motif chemokine 10-like [Cololabis saira]|uniref:C-X-C motif chemokine 10-like n=1 Tax=Cololabis saira TaxID=129043 RepID=UPI002AD33834|nr:C-X-C motif chemokine 10-like [Cololabis saira]
MNPVITFFLTCLLLLCAQGLPLSRSHKCNCSSGYVKKINPKLIQGEPQILHPSVFCPRTEIIVTIRGNQEKCLDPESLLGKQILNRYMKRRAGSSTTTTSTTTTTTTTTPHPTTGHHTTAPNSTSITTVL